MFQLYSDPDTRGPFQSADDDDDDDDVYDCVYDCDDYDDGDYGYMYE